MAITKKLILIIPFFSLFLLFVSVNFCIAQQAPPTVTNYTYDPSGQRITVSNGTTTTVYPTKNYNTDGTAEGTTKHIFANGTDAATIQGTGADAKVYYNHTDTLNSSSVITDSTGAVAETIDYFPFGAVRIDQKTGTFNEQRKYIGQEYDTDTGLNYLNARYYNATTGRFISQDPMFWGKLDLSNPQNFNSYSYARNNPIVGSDPSGLLAYFTPGFARPFKPRDTANSFGVSEVMAWMKGQVGSAEFFSWSQRDNEQAFTKAGQDLANKVMSENSKTEPIDLFSHSDGGQPSGKAAEILIKNGYNVRNIVFAGMPVRNGEFDLTGAKNVVMSYNNDDTIQTKGGKLVTTSGLIGGLAGLIAGPWGAAAGFLYGQMLGYGEIGPAGRTISGGDNVNMTKIINDHPGQGLFHEHGDTIYNSFVREELSSHIKK